MEGWKTKTGAAILIGAGVLGYGATLLGYQGMDLQTASTMVGAGMTALGLGHKFDKIKQALLEK